MKSMSVDTSPTTQITSATENEAKLSSQIKTTEKETTILRGTMKTSSGVSKTTLTKVSSAHTTLPSLSTKEISKTSIASTAPESPPRSIESKVSYLEGTDIIEQKDSYSNISREAVLEVPPHGNNSELTIIMQPTTVSSISTFGKSITNNFDDLEHKGDCTRRQMPAHFSGGRH